MIHTSFLFIQCKTISCYRLRLKQSRKYLKTQWNWFCTRLNLCLFRWFCSQKVDFLHKTVDFVSDSVPFSKARLVFWSYHMFCDQTGVQKTIWELRRRKMSYSAIIRNRRPEDGNRTRCSGGLRLDRHILELPLCFPRSRSLSAIPGHHAAKSVRARWPVRCAGRRVSGWWPHPDKPWGTGDIGQTIGPIRCWDADAGSVPEPDAVCIPYIRETVVAAASTNRSRDRRQVRRNYI